MDACYVDRLLYPRAYPLFWRLAYCLRWRAGLPYGLPPSEWANQGVFRLYFSVDPAAKLLQTDLNGGTNGGWPNAGSFSGIAGVADQVFAQGYNCSAALSAIETGGSIALSSLYPQLLKYYATKSGGGADGKLLDTVGFYWCQEFVENNPTQCILDESAGNTFANSKNASTGLSGKPKKVTIQLAGRGDISTDAETAVNRASESYAGDYGITQFRSQNIFDLEREV